MLVTRKVEAGRCVLLLNVLAVMAVMRAQASKSPKMGFSG